MVTEINLEQFQRWMQALIMHPGNDQQAVKSKEAEEYITSQDALNYILPSQTLSSLERIGIYHRMYLLRLAEALESDYGAVAHFLGDKGFYNLVRDYTQVCPSCTYTLNRLGDHLPEYIKSVTKLAKKDFLYDLARLEMAITQVFDAVEAPVLKAEDIAKIPTETWERARLKPIAGFRVLAFRYPANEYLQSVRTETPHPVIRRKDNWLAIYRNNYTVWRLPLTYPAYALLNDLANGMPLGEAIDTAIERAANKRMDWEKQVYQWFSEWIAEGMFQAIEIE